MAATLRASWSPSPAGGGVDDVCVGFRHVEFDLAHGFGGFGLGDHDFGDDEGCGSAHDAGGDEVSGDIGKEGLEHGDVGSHDAAGDGGHASGHDGEELGTGHGGDIGFDDERRLGHADEDVCDGGEGFGAGGSHEFHHDIGHSADDPLHDAEVVEDGHQ